MFKVNSRNMQHRTDFAKEKFEPKKLPKWKKKRRARSLKLALAKHNGRRFKGSITTTIA